ncbi:MAG: hypothetical protein P9L98_01635 [Candidatus Kaelpia imicola]|nr:hypothetical protein [Candidatus Kaelpia imicola]
MKGFVAWDKKGNALFAILPMEWQEDDIGKVMHEGKTWLVDNTSEEEISIADEQVKLI